MTDHPKKKSIRNKMIDEFFGKGSTALPRGRYSEGVYDEHWIDGFKGFKKREKEFPGNMIDELVGKKKTKGGKK